MEDPMTHFTSTARRIVVSALAAIALATAVPEAGFAANGSSAGLWKVNIARSKVATRSSRIVIERAKGTDGTAGVFLVISKGNAYLATPAASSGGIAQVDYSTLKGMKLVKVGTGVRAIDECGSVCRSGQIRGHLSVTFRNVGTGHEMNEAFVLNR